MSSYLMVICKYLELSFVAKLLPSSPLESLVRSFHSHFPRIPEHMYLTYSIPGNSFCVLHCQDDYENIFTMAELNNLIMIEIVLGPCPSLLSTALSESTSTIGCSTSLIAHPSCSMSSLVQSGCPTSAIIQTDDYREEANYSSQTRLSMAWKDCIVGLNQIFPNGAESFRNELAKYSMCHGFEFAFKRNTELKVKVVCAFANSNGCLWTISARADASRKLMYIYEFVGVEAHGVECITRRTSRMSSGIVCEVVLEKMRVNPRYAPKDAQAAFKSDYNVKISYTLAHTGVEKARDLMFGEYRLSYDQLLKYSDAARESNHGSHIVFEADPETKKFIRLFICFNACIKGFHFCRPILFLDGTFLTNRYKGQMLCATAKDGNNHLFPLCYAIVDSETIENWGWVLDQLSIVLRNEERQLTFVSDRNQSILNSVSKYFPESPHGYCTYHLKCNLRSRMSGKPKEIREAILKMFDKVIYAKTKAQFDINLEAVMKSGGSKVKDFFKDLLPEHYAQAFFVGARYGELTSNAAESLNNKFVSERQLPIIGLVDGIRKSIMTDMAFQRDLSHRWVFKICPEYDKLLIDKIGIAKQWSVSKSSNDLYEVNAKKLVSVNLGARTCSCLSWQLDLFPCAHAVAAILESQRPIESFVDSYFHTETFCQTYVVPMNPISTIYLEENSSSTCQVLPPTLKAQPGRPKTKRKRSSGEKRRDSRCTLCRKKGHNQRSCPATEE